MSCLKLKGDCAFSVAAPRLWGDLLVHIDVDSIKSSLKTHLFLWLLDQCNFTNQSALLLVFIFDCLMYSTCGQQLLFTFALEIKMSFLVFGLFVLI